MVKKGDTLYSIAKANNVDVLLCDTAGRLQNKVNLMKELEKIYRVTDNFLFEVF